MSYHSLLNIRKAITSLNSKKVRERCERPLHVALYAASPDRYAVIEEFLLQNLSPDRRRDSLAAISRGPDPAQALRYDLAIYDESVIAPSRSIVFQQRRSKQFISDVLGRHEDLHISLARNFSPFRKPVVDHVISKTCRDNTLFSLATALPDIIPSMVELPWAVAEFASDSAFLTMNQIQMAFLIAGASDRSVGYSDQKSEVATIVASAFGWRALARQLVGKIPFGAGLIPKAAIAYAGTKVLGLSLDRFYAVGYNYTKQEREELYVEAFQHGKQVARQILGRLRPDLAKRQAEEVEVPRSGGVPLIEQKSQ